MSQPTRTPDRARVLAAGSMLIAVVAPLLAGCGDPNNPPQCDDYSASGARLAHGCRHDGTTEQSHAVTCANGTTLYNVPIGQQGGVSGYSNGKIRPDVATQQEVATCLGA